MEKKKYNFVKEGTTPERSMEIQAVFIANKDHIEMVTSGEWEPAEGLTLELLIKLFKRPFGYRRIPSKYKKDTVFYYEYWVKNGVLDSKALKELHGVDFVRDHLDEYITK